MPALLRRSGYLDENCNLIKKIDLTSDDITRMVKEYYGRWKNNTIGQKRRRARFTKLDNTHVKSNATSNNSCLSSLSDLDMVEELRSRGYDVKCTKQIDL